MGAFSAVRIIWCGSRFGVGNILHLLRGNIKLLCKDSTVALRLIEHEDKIAVL